MKHTGFNDENQWLEDADLAAEWNLVGSYVVV